MDSDALIGPMKTRPSGLTDAINEMLGDYSMTLICYLYIMHMPTE